ncbi:endolytic transglycosylase MltG [Actinomyces gaoshouyii]|uniref:Endolytic murein transglycosylase n=1 Tax=Actinomyces gaoshouyii TaxID=1960083 RepID=A0A8H9H937_9ACTO|nr:endolytic transglycosylase MltG [Actinomyces gaoshouyii]ARD41652.1 aminodeoxychorismate lyase [Actinomyces gaoshouyii]GGO97977.1 ABC transporter substrate-binding protein [Actinomyces gaoshouyii]
MSQDDLFEQIGIISDDPLTAEPPSRRGKARREKARKKRRFRRHVLTVLILSVAVAGAGAGAYWGYGVLHGVREQQSTVADYSGEGEGSVIVEIPQSATGAIIADLLYKNDVVASPKAFIDAFNANSESANIQPGTYTLKQRMSGASAVAALLDPASRADHSLTIPEGFTKDQVKEKIMSVMQVSAEDVDAAYKDLKGIGLPEAAKGDVEGWLAPGTYGLKEGETVTQVVARMVSATMARLQKLGFDPAGYEDALIKASIVEREAGSQQNFGKVARVVENRLTKQESGTGGRLEMDSTILYGLGRTGGVPSKEEVDDASNPYNTYRNAGLPPTPIGSPGEAALKAVASPEPGDWLYFVTVDLNTGKTLFAKTKEEQDENTKKLTAFCQAHPDVCNGSSATATPTPAG